ncbi:unnamed protein product, partial [Dibothriocephalus latus]
KRSLTNSIPNAYNDKDDSLASSDGKKRCRKLSSEQVSPTSDTEVVNGRIRDYLRDSFSPTASSLQTSQPKYFNLQTSNPLPMSQTFASSPRPTGGTENPNYNPQQEKQQQHQQSRGGFLNAKFFSGLKPPFNFSASPEEETEQEEAGIVGPELLVAAYNFALHIEAGPTDEIQGFLQENPSEAKSVLAAAVTVAKAEMSPPNYVLRETPRKNTTRRVQQRKSLGVKGTTYLGQKTSIS